MWPHKARIGVCLAHQLGMMDDAVKALLLLRKPLVLLRASVDDLQTYRSKCLCFGMCHQFHCISARC